MEAVTLTDKVEAYAASWAYPLLLQHLPPGFKVVPVPSSIEMQHKFGDAWLACHASKMSAAVELKSERKHTGYLAIETHSDEPNCVLGWLYKYTDDVHLLYAFNDIRVAYVCTMGALRKWACSHGVSCRRRIEDFEERQPRLQQRNVTVFRLVPVAVFLEEVQGALVLHDYIRTL